MSKKSVKTLFALAGATALFSIAGGVFAWDFHTVSADETAQTTDFLIAPTTYEEYLPLTAPQDVAYGEYYTAIADGNGIFVYDRQKKTYSKYTHEVNGGSMDMVKKIQLGKANNLYFADNSSGDNFYELNLKTLTITQKFDAIACNTFIIDDETLYFANSVGALFSTSLTDEHATRSPLPLNNDPRKPTLAFWNNELYFTDNGATQILYKINPDEGIPTQVATPENNIEYMCIKDGVLNYTCSSGGFYSYQLNAVGDDGLLFAETENIYASLSVYADWVHLVNGDKIRRYSLAEKQFTDFEICSSSSAQNRLSSATKLALDGDSVYIADNGNARISLYDTSTQTFIDSFPVTLLGSYLSATENSVLTATETALEIYENGVKSYETQNLDGNIVGTAGVYGKYYLATDRNFFYCLSKSENAWRLQEVRKTSTRYPNALTHDIYGNLYIRSGAYLYAFTESEYLTPEKEGVQVCDDLPVSTQEIMVDYKNNVYALAQNKVYKNGVEIDFSTPLVYAQSTTVRSFVFGAEDETAYFLTDDHYIFASNRLALPTVKTIPVKGADEEVFKAQSAVFSVVQTQENALFIAFDLASLNGAEHFPYLSYKRSEAVQTALKIGETDEYSLIAVFNKGTQRYETFVVDKDACAPLDENEFFEKLPETTAYITSQVYLYKFPYLTELLTVQRLPRNAKVTIKGEIKQLDHEYYEITYGDYTGFVPKSFVSGISASPPDSTTEIYGSVENNDDGAFRLAYILLGTAVIGILVDYLILKNKRKEEK